MGDDKHVALCTRQLRDVGELAAQDLRIVGIRQGQGGPQAGQGDGRRNLAGHRIRDGRSLDHEELLFLQVLKQPEHPGVVGAEVGIEVVGDTAHCGAEVQRVVQPAIDGLPVVRLGQAGRVAGRPAAAAADQIDDHLAAIQAGQCHDFAGERALRCDRKRHRRVEFHQRSGGEEVVADLVDDERGARLAAQPPETDAVGQQAVDADGHLRPQRPVRHGGRDPRGDRVERGDGCVDAVDGLGGRDRELVGAVRPVECPGGFGLFTRGGQRPLQPLDGGRDAGDALGKVGVGFEVRRRGGLNHGLRVEHRPGR